MRIYITGVAGFIGSHLLDALGDDHYVYGTDTYTTGRRENLPGDVDDVPIGHADGADVIIHCAATYADPDAWQEDIAANTGLTATVARKALDWEARVIYFQTALPPISSYAITKIAGEQYLNMAGVPLTVFRLANVYGPRNLSGPIPTFYKRITTGQTCAVVDTHRDLVYIHDLVRVVQYAVNHPDLQGRYDVCSGREYSIREIHRAVAAELGVVDKPELAARRPDDVEAMTLDPGPLRTLGVTMDTPLREGIAAAVAWYRDNDFQRTYTHLRGLVRA